MPARNYNLASGLRADARSSISYLFLFRAHRLVDARDRSGRVRRLSRTGFSQPALLADAIADVPSDNLRHAFDEARSPGDRSRRLFGTAGTWVLLAEHVHYSRGTR